MVFYLDLILLLNLVIDYFILLVTGKYLHLHIKKWRILIGAIFGALYSLLFFVPNLAFSQLFITKIILSIVIVWISFGFIHLFRFIQTIATFYFISFLTGGGVLAMQYFFNMDHEVINGIYVSHSSNPLWTIIFILVAFAGILIFSHNTIHSLRRNENEQQQIIDVEIEMVGRKCECKGLVDTGNRLYDPITRKPVMILEANGNVMIPTILKEAYVNGQFQLDLFQEITNQLDNNWLSRIKLVPFRSVSKEMQLLLTIRPDKVVIKTKEETEIVSTKVLVGLVYGQISNDHSYQAIIHPEILVG